VLACLRAASIAHIVTAPGGCKAGKTEYVQACCDPVCGCRAPPGAGGFVGGVDPGRAAQLAAERRLAVEQLERVAAIAEGVSAGYSLLTEDDEQAWHAEQARLSEQAGAGG
jgi:hypothetical protein